MEARLSVNGSHLCLDGKPYRILSGAMHYFRIHPDLWKDRLEKAAQMGLNCIETYCAWNLHEPRRGEYCFEGFADLERYIRLAQEAGLYVIIRPGPYICAEWENGGIPYWQTQKFGLKIRSSEPEALEEIKKWFHVLIPKITPYQYTNGGPVIMMAVENEYGSIGKDKVYLAALRDTYLELGVNIPLFTADGATLGCLYGGTIDGAVPALNFAPMEITPEMWELPGVKDAPKIAMEYWCGAYDHWGFPGDYPSQEKILEGYDTLLSWGVSVNLYMFHGGTNFGFWNGANLFPGEFMYDTASYDYAAPLSEDGEPTELYWKFREIIKKYRPGWNAEKPSPVKRISPAPVLLKEQAKLFDQLDNLSKPVYSKNVCSMEEIGTDYGFILYTTEVKGPRKTEYDPVRIFGVRDRATAYVNGKHIGTVERRTGDMGVPMTAEFLNETNTLSVLAENCGRINFSSFFGEDPKGIVKGIAVALQYQQDYEVRALPMNDLSKLEYSKAEITEEDPSFYRGTFDLEETGDTFLKFPGKHGFVWLNGFNLGRYCEEGPGDTLYIPAPLLKKGKNELIVFEIHKLKELQISFTAVR